MRAALALGLLGAGGIGCGSHAAPPDLAAPDLAAPPLCTDAPDGGASASFANVQRLFSENCAVPLCHDGTMTQPDVMQDLRDGRAYASIVGRAATEICDGGAPQTRVVPGDAGASWLYRKLVEPAPCVGGQMPQGETPMPLPDCEIDLVRRWIESGAPK